MRVLSTTGLKKKGAQEDGIILYDSLHAASKVESNQPYLCAVQDSYIDTLDFGLSDTTSVAVGDSAYLMPLDSVVPIVEEPVPSLFEAHEIPIGKNPAYIERVDSVGSFGFLILLLCGLIIVYVQRNSDNVFSHILKASFDVNQANQDARVENSQRSRNLFIVQVIAIISVSLFATGALMRLFSWQMPMSQLFLVATAVVAVGVVGKRILLWLLAQLFDLSNELRFHSFNQRVLFSATGLALLPLSLLLYYSPQIPFEVIIYLGAAVGILLYLKGLQRGISIALASSSVSTLHLFYYFCALEILPAFVLIRLMQNL